MRAATTLVGLALAGLALSGCETSAEKSAQLEHEAKRHPHQSQQSLTITKPSTQVKVLSAQIVRSSQGTAAVVTLRNTGSSAQRDLPILIMVHGAHNKVLFQNNAGGLEAALTSVALLEPGVQTIWIDDQVQTAETPSSVSALVGEGNTVPSSVPRIRVSDISAVEGAGGVPAAAGTVHNDSAITQQSLVVYGIALRAGRIVGAGRAIVPELAPHASDKVEIYFAGQIQGAQLQISAPATTFS